MVVYRFPPLCYPKLPITDVLRTTAKRLPNKHAIVYPEKITFKELWNNIDRFAAALADLGVKKGDKVAIFEGNNPEFPVALQGILEVGGVAVSVNPMSKERELEYEVNDSEASTLVVRDELFPVVKKTLPKMPRLRRIIVIGEEKKETYSFSGLLEKYPPEPPKVDINHKDHALILYSSGTTGLPKGCVYTHYAHNASYIQCTWAGWEKGENDIVMAFLPYYHIYGMVCILNSSLYTGASQVLMKRFQIQEMCKLIQEHKVTLVPLVPPIMVTLVKKPELLTKYDWSSVRTVGISAAPTPMPVMKKFQKITGIKVMHFSGLTEGAPFSANPFYKMKVKSAGIPMPDTRIKVLDLETDKELPIGEKGEMVFKGPQVMEGYWKKPQITEETFITFDGERWVRTGDIGYMDEEGYVYFVDRKKEVIKYKGYSVAPAEVESVVIGHPAVRECAVVGKPDEIAGEIPKAYIMLKKGVTATEEDIIEFVNKRISSYKRIREVEFVDYIPKTASGKILRRSFKEREQKRHGSKDPTEKNTQLYDKETSRTYE